MTFSRLVFTFYLAATVVHVSVPSMNWGQVLLAPDPDVPSYVSPDHVSGKLTISAPETMKPLVGAWVEELVRRHPDLNLTMVREGSDTGFAALLEHRSEIAAMPRRVTADEIAEFVKEYGYEPTEIPVAGDALAIFVHKDNPVTGLSLDELDSMFCEERRRGLKYIVDSWGLVGVMDEWFEAPVQLHGKNGKSRYSYFFREEVCKGGTFRLQLTDAQGPASVVLDVETDPKGIGFSAIGYGTSMVKPVPIALVKGGRYIEPSIQTVMDGSYPLRRNLYLYAAKPPKAEATTATIELIRYILSRQGQQEALDLGYLPLPSDQITRLISKWSKQPTRAARLETPNRPVIE
ncbi:MAG: substrate-binding domain-containing protein [Nitrospira sp.]|nr:substrate-binding domain-containing protein [Nitrospira sp.]